MKKLFPFLFILALVVVIACSDDDDDTTVSDQAELISFSVDATTGFTPFKTIVDSIEMIALNANDFVATDYPITLTPNLVMSEGATSSPASGTPVTFNAPEDFVAYRITSEDGANSTEYIFTIRDGQMPNSDFENWFTAIGMNSQPFLEPGKHLESTVWATANMGTSIYSIYGTSPLEEGGNTAVQIETVTTVALPLVAGALYIGEFDLDGAIADPTNPVAAAKLGIPFAYTPTAVKFKYMYKSGDQMIQATLKDPGNLFGGFDVVNLSGKDKYGIEVRLEKRVDGEAVVAAQSNVSDDTEVGTMTEMVIPISWESNQEPTHFYISFSPSLDGGDFKGAIGSTLVIDDIELIYD